MYKHVHFYCIICSFFSIFQRWMIFTPYLIHISIFQRSMIFEKYSSARNVWNWGSGVCVHMIFLRIFVAKCRFLLCFWKISSTATEAYKIIKIHCIHMFIQCFVNFIVHCSILLALTALLASLLHLAPPIMLWSYVLCCEFMILILLACLLCFALLRTLIFQKICFARNVWNWCFYVYVHTIFLRIFVAKCRFLLCFWIFCSTATDPTQFNKNSKYNHLKNWNV